MLLHPFRQSINRLRKASRPAARRKGWTFRPAIEGLEARCLLSASGLNAGIASAAIATGSPKTAPTLPQADATAQAHASQAYGQIPLSFEANQGQTDANVDFLSRGAGYTLFLTSGDALLALQQGSGNAASGPAGQSAVLHMQLIGADPAARSIGLNEQAGVTNYLTGDDPTQWHTNVANYGKVEYQNVYAGINVVYYGNQRQLEYDFVVAPGADPNAIQLSFQGAERTSIDADGNLVLHAAGGDVIEHTPIMYQEINGVRQAVAGRYVLEDNGQAGFKVGVYDTSRPLVIDPVLSYSTYLGGTANEDAYSIAVDDSGNAYVTGFTVSTNFPTKNPYQASLGNSGDVFVSKLNAAGTAFVYSTYLGGSDSDTGNGIALFTDRVTGKTNAVITGNTFSTNFPTTGGAFQTVRGGSWDAFVTELNDTGSGLLYSSYLGGSGRDEGRGIAVDAAGNAYVTGATESTNFPTTLGTFQTDFSSGTQSFVAELNATGSALVYSTYLGPDLPHAIALDGSGNAYITGSTSSTNFPTTLGAFETTPGGNNDAFVTKLFAGGTGLAYSTYLGGSGGTTGDVGTGIAVFTDAGGNTFAYVTGSTESTNFPVTPGALQTVIGGVGDAFVAKLNSLGTALVYSTYLGGSGNDGGFGIAVDGAGNAYVTGQTASTNFPTANAMQSAYAGGDADAFVAKIDPNLSGASSLLFSTYLGGSVGGDAGFGIAVDSTGNAYVAGATSSTNFPTKNALQGTFGGPLHTSDAFVTKITPPAAATSPVLLVTGFPSSTTAGAAAAFTVSARDVSGATLAGFTGTVHFSSSDPQAVLPADYTFTAADQGMHTFSATLKTAGTQTLDAAVTITPITPGMSGTEASIFVNPATAVLFQFSGQSSIGAGKSFNITVTALDAYGNVATGYTGMVHFTSTDPAATLPADFTFTAADNGVHTFKALKLKTKGPQTITLVTKPASTITGSLNIAVT